MNNHSHKEPPLRGLVKHNSELLSKFGLVVSYVFFALVFGFVIAGVFE